MGKLSEAKLKALQELIDAEEPQQSKDDNGEFVEVYRVKKADLAWLFSGQEEGEPAPTEDDKTDPPKKEPEPSHGPKWFVGK